MAAVPLPLDSQNVPVPQLPEILAYSYTTNTLSLQSDLLTSGRTQHKMPLLMLYNGHYLTTVTVYSYSLIMAGHSYLFSGHCKAPGVHVTYIKVSVYKRYYFVRTFTLKSENDNTHKNYNYLDKCFFEKCLILFQGVNELNLILLLTSLSA
jgi:hypothetical protein